MNKKAVFYYAVKYICPTIVSAFPIGEPIIASILAYFIFSEIIGLDIILTLGIIIITIIGVIIIITIIIIIIIIIHLM